MTVESNSRLMARDLVVAAMIGSGSVAWRLAFRDG
jgi:hypothetical protein